MSGLLPVGGMPLAYEGSIAVPFIIRNFAPNSTNNTFNVPTFWIDPADQIAWILLSKANGVADWAPFASAAGSVTKIHTPDGTTVVPSVGLINFLNGTGMNITGSTNNITFNSIGGGFSWINVTTTPQALSPGDGYVADSGSQIVFTLPAIAAFGDSYSIVGLGAGGWTVTQNSGQSIIMGSQTTTTTTGSLTSTLQSDTITLLCVTANTIFKVIESNGIIEVI